MADRAPRGPILLAYDGSDPAAVALRQAGALLRGHKTLVVHTWVGLSHFLLHTASEGIPGALGEAADEIDAGGEQEAEAVAAAGAKLATDAGLPAEALALRESRNPWRTLLDAAAEHGAQGIVVGARGQSALRAAVLGSVSSGLVHHADRPVLVVPDEQADSAGGPLVAAYDGSENAARAIRCAGSLMPGREAVVLNSWSPWRDRVIYAPGMSKSLAGMASELDVTAENESTELAEQGVQLAADAGLRAEPRSRSDPAVAQAILNEADELEAAAIILGARGLTGIAAALGGVSHSVLYRAGRPVLIVPQTS